MQSEMFTKQPTVDVDIEFDIKLLATEYFEGTVCTVFNVIIVILVFLYLNMCARELNFIKSKPTTVVERNWLGFLK